MEETTELVEKTRPLLKKLTRKSRRLDEKRKLLSAKSVYTRRVIQILCEIFREKWLAENRPASPLPQND